MFKFQAIGFISKVSIVLLLLCTSVSSQEIVVHSYNKDIQDAILYLEKVSEVDRPFIRFFSTSSIKEEDKEKTVLVLSFVLHSLTGLGNDITGNAGGYYPIARMEEIDVFVPDVTAGQKKEKRFVPYTQVPHSNLYWIDIRNYNWTPQAWEKISSTDGYYVEPIISHPENSLLRLLSGNSIVRADWFIAHATDTTMQSDKSIPVDFYRTLIYANATEIPKTVADLEKFWGLDKNEHIQLGTNAASITTSSDIVARHNRILFYYRTGFGYWYESFDVLNQLGKKDYVATFPEMRGLPPSLSDAGELFFTNAVQMQIYDLRDGNGNLVNFADPTVARHISDVSGDTRVRVANSCIDCHAAGPLPAQNTLKSFIEKANIYIPAKEDQLRIERVYLSNRFEDSINDSQELYARALLKVNGLTPEQNAQYYLDIVDKYKDPITLEKAAFECGLSVEEFKSIINKKMSEEGSYPPGRLAILMTINDTIPREVWESRGRDGIPGMFQQTMIFINGLTQIEYIEEIPAEIITEEVSTEENVEENITIPLTGQTTKLRRPIEYNGEQIPVGTTLSYPDIDKLKNKDEILKYEESNDVITLVYNNQLIYVNRNNIGSR